jgi:hypothetical protein
LGVMKLAQTEGWCKEQPRMVTSHNLGKAEDSASHSIRTMGDID